jgi:hypothetical protein
MLLDQHTKGYHEQNQTRDHYIMCFCGIEISTDICYDNYAYHIHHGASKIVDSSIRTFCREVYMVVLENDHFDKERNR